MGKNIDKDVKFIADFARELKQDFFGETKTPFVGRYGYPNVNLGILSPPGHREDIERYDDPRGWAAEELGIADIVGFRSQMINSRTKSHVRQGSRILDLTKEIGMSSRAVDVEINLERAPVMQMNMSRYSAPRGPNAILKKAVITSNSKIPRQVDRIVDDKDLKAAEGLNLLFNKGFDENFLSRLLSVGNLGVDRKLVPTRWSITATDDTIGKRIIEEIKRFDEHDHALYSGHYLGNHYFVMLFPEVWSYELFEMRIPDPCAADIPFDHDYEFYEGRKNYAESCEGGYYAARLPILERLRKSRRQAGILVLRFVTRDYNVPLGVWVVREAVRKAVTSKPLSFSSSDEMISYVRNLVIDRLGFDASYLIDKSALLKEMKRQTKLSRFF